MLAALQVVLRVDMTCGGCSGAVKRILDKMDGVHPGPNSPCLGKVVPAVLAHVAPSSWPVCHSPGVERARVCCGTALDLGVHDETLPAGVESYDIDLEQKKVVVRGNVTPEQCVEKISKMGKETTVWK